jgi:predicted chitinase
MSSDTTADQIVSPHAADRSPGDITEFPAVRDLAGPAAPEEDDYHPEFLEEEGVATRAVSGVAWARNDRASACYQHLLVDGADTVTADSSFEFGKPEMELLITANRYRPRGSGDIIAFGLRGAKLRGAEKFEQADRLPLEDARPDHKTFRCVMGFYFRATGKFSAFTASTVPWHLYMTQGMANNLLPTGCYVYKKGVHRPATQSRWVDPALRLSDANGAESGPATVLRTSNNLVYEIGDTWQTGSIGDNIHCAYSSGSFSSLGCQTVKGGMHDGLWALFQATLKTLPANARVDYLLTTGAECSIAAAAVKAGVPATDPEVERRLVRLRAGSEGDEVKRLQAIIGGPQTGYFGPETKKKLTDYQAAHGIPSDGIFSPAMDTVQGLGVFSSAPDPTSVPGAMLGTQRSIGGEEGTPMPPPEPPVAASQPAPAAQPAPAPVPRPDPAPAAQPAPAPVPRPGVDLTAETFKKFAPNARPEYASVLGEKGDEVLARFGINANTLRFCHFMAQVAHESAGFKATEEDLRYSAATMNRLHGVPLEEARQLVGKPQQIAERIYGLPNPRKARMLGNTQPGDGYKFRGRGFIQLTGRSNYTDIGRRTGLDLANNPDLAAQPANALLCAAGFWDRGNLNQYADQNNINIITQRINGGHNGLADRKNEFAKAQRIWGGPGGGGVGRSIGPDMGFQGGRPRLEYGDFQPEVLEAKRLLANAGYTGFIMDEEFSRATHMAVVQFKMDRGLPGDGIIDQETWNALETETKSSSRGIAPPAGTLEDDDEQSRRRGRAVQGWGRFLFVAATGIIGARLLLDRGFVWPRSPWEWMVLGFIALVVIGSFALMAIGGRLVRAGRTRPVAPGPLDDVVIRPSANPEQTGMSWTRGIEAVEFSLVKGKRYKGKITLTGFESWASNSMVADKFRELGFTDVSISGSGGTRTGEGKWDKPDQSIPMPSQISDVVEVA